MLLSVDSSILLAWLKGEHNDQELANGVRDIFLGLNSGKYRIILPSILETEMPESLIREKNGIRAAMARTEVMRQMDPVADPPGLHEQISRLRRELKLDLADANHVAMAIMAKCRYHCTNDKGVLSVADAIKAMTGNNTEIIKPPLPNVDDS